MSNVYKIDRDSYLKVVNDGKSTRLNIQNKVSRMSDEVFNSTLRDSGVSDQYLNNCQGLDRVSIVQGTKPSITNEDLYDSMAKSNRIYNDYKSFRNWQDRQWAIDDYKDKLRLNGYYTNDLHFS